MRRTSRQRTAFAQTTSSTPSAQSSLAPPPHGASLANGTTVSRDFGSPAAAVDDPPATEVLLSPADTFVADGSVKPEPDGGLDHRQLAVVIRQRIESRLGGRVRELSVRIQGDTILLEGKCSTYYTKQLAQHAALGVLEDEHLENAIAVEVPR